MFSSQQLESTSASLCTPKKCSEPTGVQQNGSYQHRLYLALHTKPYIQYFVPLQRPLSRFNLKGTRNIYATTHQHSQHFTVRRSLPTHVRAPFFKEERDTKSKKSQKLTKKMHTPSNVRWSGVGVKRRGLIARIPHCMDHCYGSFVNTHHNFFLPRFKNT